jgi:hypothetical protein
MVNWRTFIISLLLGLGIDVGLVWLYYWWVDEPFKWVGFWVWQAVMIGAGILLWLRRLLGFLVWYFLFGRDLLASEAFQKFIEHEFEPFDKNWDNTEGWLIGHVQENRSAAASSLITSAAVIRQVGLWQYHMLISAYKKAAIRYSSYVKRREL